MGCGPHPEQNSGKRLKILIFSRFELLVIRARESFSAQPFKRLFFNSMSIRVMSSVWDSDIKDTFELLVLLALADFANDEGVSWPSLDRLAQKARCSRRGLQNILKRLEEVGILTVKRKGGGPPESTNSYKINLGLRGERGAPLKEGEGCTRRHGGVHPATRRGEPGADEGCTASANDPSVIRHRSVIDPPSPSPELALNGVEGGKSELPLEAIYWNSNCGDLAKVLSAGTSRLRHLLMRRKNQFWASNFQEAVRRVASSHFCNGKNDRGWKATFDWMVEQPDVVTKVMEGKYDNRFNGSSLKANTAQEIAKSWGVEC
jgi:hypothetical protein